MIVGRGGADAIWGNGGNDLICAGPGNDRVVGKAGIDTLIAGAGVSSMSFWKRRWIEQSRSPRCSTWPWASARIWTSTCRGDST